MERWEEEEEPGDDDETGDADVPEEELRPACEACRTLHRFCDGVLPTCGMCRKRNVACVRLVRNKPGPAPRARAPGSAGSRRRAGATATTTMVVFNKPDGQGGRRSSASSRPGPESGGKRRRWTAGADAMPPSSSAVSLPVERDLVSADVIRSFYDRFTAHIGHLFVAVNVDSIINALRRDNDDADESHTVHKFLGLAITGIGAAKQGNMDMSLASVRRATDLSNHRHLVAPSARALVAMSNLLLGFASLMQENISLAAGFHRRAYNGSRWRPQDPAGENLQAAPDSENYTLDTVHLMSGAHLLSMTTTAAEAVALINECSHLSQLDTNLVGRCMFRVGVVRQLLVEAYSGNRHRASSPSLLADELIQEMRDLAHDTLSVIRIRSPPIACHSALAAANNYLGVQALTHLIFGDRVAASAAALAILRLSLSMPASEAASAGYNVKSLTAALKVFMDLGMLDEVSQTLAILETSQKTNVLARRILEFARTGTCPVVYEGLAALEIALLTASFRKRTAAHSAAAFPGAGAAGASHSDGDGAVPTRHLATTVICLQDQPEWRYLIGQEEAGPIPSDTESPTLVPDLVPVSGGESEPASVSPDPPLSPPLAADWVVSFRQRTLSDSGVFPILSLDDSGSDSGGTGSATTTTLGWSPTATTGWADDGPDRSASSSPSPFSLTSVIFGHAAPWPLTD